MDNDLISREALKEDIVKLCRQINASNGITVPTLAFTRVIDSAPTVEPFEPDYVGAERFKARQRGYESGYHYGMEIGKTLNPRIKQGEWIECTKSGMPLTEYGRMTGKKWYGFKCSCCNYIYKGNALIESPYCQKCGAVMQK